MSKVNPESIHEISFDKEDLKAFNGSNDKVVHQVQSQFFPRLKLMLDKVIEVLYEDFGIDVNNIMSVTQSPNPRKTTNTRDEISSVLVGLSGVVRKNENLISRNLAGNPYKYHSSRLFFNINDDGLFNVQMYWSSNKQSNDYASKLVQVIQINKDVLSKYCDMFEIRLYSSKSKSFIDISEISIDHLTDEMLIFEGADDYSFPVENENIFICVTDFIALYPLLELAIFTEKGRNFDIVSRIQQVYEWVNTYSDEDEILQDEAEYENSIPDVDNLEIVSEGHHQLVAHYRRERNRQIVQKKKQQVLSETGTLECEVCGFDFGKTYGERGKEFCEVHHKIPLSEATDVVKTKLSDLAIVCSNCHRMIHRKQPALAIEELQELLVR